MIVKRVTANYTTVIDRLRLFREEKIKLEGERERGIDVILSSSYLSLVA